MLPGSANPGVVVRLEEPAETGEVDIGGAEGSIPKLLLSSSEKMLFRSEGPKYWESEDSCCMPVCPMNDIGQEFERSGVCSEN